MPNFEIKPASRSAVKALCGFYGRSGGGKTMSALLFARGLVGPTGRIVMIDTENKRGSLFADLIPGSYSTLDLSEPFSPSRYQQAVEAAESAADVIVIDSMSHEHSGEGGVLDMQEAELTRMAGAENWGKREQCKMAAWIKPKMEHKKFVNRLLRSPCHIICCLRGEQKTRMEKGANGKLEVEKDEFTTCIADPRLIFEFLINLEVYEKDGNGGYCHIRKITHTGTRACLPTANEQVGIKHGEALAKWCAAPGGPGAQRPTDSSSLKALKSKLREITYPVHGWKTEHGAEAWIVKKKALAAFLADECRIDTVIDAMSAQQLTEAIAAAEKKLAVPV